MLCDYCIHQGVTNDVDEYIVHHGLTVCEDCAKAYGLVNSDNKIMEFDMTRQEMAIRYKQTLEWER